MTWFVPMIVGLVLVIGGVAMLIHVNTLNRTLPPRSPDGTLDGTLPDRGAFGLPYQRRDRVANLRRNAIGVIVVAGVLALVSAAHLLGH